MKKPLILLIDDDPSVLEALEAELRPAFEEICRIETFDHPEDVLASMRGWVDERRKIALAIVDQKMPAMTGVELLVRLRTAARHHEVASAAVRDTKPHPATHLHAVLLTGYSELDIALAAKNEAGVAAFATKPWSGEGLLNTLRRLLRNFLANSGMDHHLRFREVTDAVGIAEQLKMRFDVMATVAGQAEQLPKDTGGRDVDAFDIYSRFVGLFVADLLGEIQAGSMRVTSANDALAPPAFASVVQGKPRLIERATAERMGKLPLVPRLYSHPDIVMLVDQLLGAGEKVVEPGRLVMLPAFRGTLEAGSASRHLIESMIAYTAWGLTVENALLTCFPAHTPFYRRLGFKWAGGKSDLLPGMLGEVHCLHARASEMPAESSDRIQLLAQRLDERGFACRCATFPSCTTGPYQSGHFTDTDLFCPVRACEQLARAPILAPDQAAAAE